jgi:hypothetical protein
MDKTKVSSNPKNVVERNIALTGELMRYLIEHPQLFNSLPETFELIILPDDDPEIRAYNLDLLDGYGSEGKLIVFARITSSRERDIKQIVPSLYAPVPA